MRTKDIEKIISREGDELLRKKRSGILSACGVKESKVTRKTVKTARPSLVRTLAIAAAIMLLAAGMIAALPLLRTNPELPPDPATDPVIGESTTEEIQGTTSNNNVPEYPPIWRGFAQVRYAIVEIINVNKSSRYIDNTQTFAVECKVLFAHSAEFDLQADILKQPNNAKSLFDVSEFYFSANTSFEIKGGEILMFQVERGHTSTEYYYYPRINNSSSEFFRIENNKITLSDKDRETVSFVAISHLNEAIKSQLIYEKNLKPIEDGSTFEDIKHFFITIQSEIDKSDKMIFEMQESGIPS